MERGAPVGATTSSDPGNRRRYCAGSLVLAAVCTLSLVGCAVGPDYVPPQLEVPAHWSNRKHARPTAPTHLKEWWRRLRDPVLNALIDEAVAGNLNVATAMARVRESRASYRQIVAGLLPTISGRAAATRSSTGDVAVSPPNVPSLEATPGNSAGGVDQTGNFFRVGFDASWELDLFGANRRNAEAAWYGMEAAEKQLDAALLTLIGDVATAYVNARGHEARIALARRTAQAQRETAALTQTRFAAGAVSAVDLSNAEGLASSTEANIPAIEILHANALNRLGVLIGREPAAVVGLLRGGAPIPSPRLPIATGVPADILSSRPDVRLAERQLAEATARIGQAEAARYPNVSLTGNIITSGTKIGDLGKNSSIGWSFGPTLTVPIFNAGRLAAAVDVAGARRDQQFLAYRSIVLTALEEVENAILALVKGRIRGEKLAASVTSYREAATLSRSLYQGGSASFLNVLDAQRSLYGAEEALIQTRIAIATDYIALHKALGGGWDGMLDVSRPEIIDGNTAPHVPLPWNDSRRDLHGRGGGSSSSINYRDVRVHNSLPQRAPTQPRTSRRAGSS